MTSSSAALERLKLMKVCCTLPLSRLHPSSPSGQHLNYTVGPVLLLGPSLSLWAFPPATELCLALELSLDLILTCSLTSQLDLGPLIVDFHDDSFSFPSIDDFPEAEIFLKFSPNVLQLLKGTKPRCGLYAVRSSSRYQTLMHHHSTLNHPELLWHSEAVLGLHRGPGSLGPCLSFLFITLFFVQNPFHLFFFFLLLFSVSCPRITALSQYSRHVPVNRLLEETFGLDCTIKLVVHWDFCTLDSWAITQQNLKL